MIHLSHTPGGGIPSRSPRHGGAGPQPAPVAGAQERAGSPKPVALVIDDDQDIRQALTTLLEDEGFHCVAVDNGAHALELLRQGAVRPAVILLDLMMPIMSGWEFREAQLANAELAAIPVIILTAANDNTRTSDLGVHQCLRKPVDIDELFETLQRYVPGWEPGMQD